jgi:hypothetical protein
MKKIFSSFLIRLRVLSSIDLISTKVAQIPTKSINNFIGNQIQLAISILVH